MVDRPYAGLQQRALLPIRTAFPWPNRLQIYDIFTNGKYPKQYFGGLGQRTEIILTFAVDLWCPSRTQ
jgi:hypothetical protein